jgi:hypothetical protein
VAVALNEEAAREREATLEQMRGHAGVHLEAEGKQAPNAGKDEEGLHVRKEISRELTKLGDEGNSVGPVRYEYATILTNIGKTPTTGVALEDRVPLELIDPSSVKLVNKKKEEVAPTLDSATGEMRWNAEQAGVEVIYDPQTGRLAWTIGDLEYKDPYAKAWCQFLLSIGAILGCFAGPLMANVLGRRPAYFLLCLFSLASCAYLFRVLDEFNWIFIATTAVVGLVTASFYGWLPLYLPELFPTRVRATGQGIAFNFGRILAAAGALTTGQLVGLFGGYAQACATITLVYIVGMMLIWLAPETKGRPLPD